MYQDRVPTYRYELPCGHEFHSHTPAVPLQGRHWFYCYSCQDYALVDSERTIEHPPRGRSRRLADTEVATALDKALLKDRIAVALRCTWGAVTQADLAVELGVPLRLVSTVSADLGVLGFSEYAGVDAR